MSGVKMNDLKNERTDHRRYTQRESCKSQRSTWLHLHWYFAKNAWAMVRVPYLLNVTLGCMHKSDLLVLFENTKRNFRWLKCIQMFSEYLRPVKRPRWLMNVITMETIRKPRLTIVRKVKTGIHTCDRFFKILTKFRKWLWNAPLCPTK